jgi:hypothetical protein
MCFAPIREDDRGFQISLCPRFDEGMHAVRAGAIP